ncbi:hypothetical protein JCGZ_00463 [Jatropha curcas]|uniref:Uncharacterized protein n=1 Tax=Jatropha curcas TaxID=180498 RepID=A0A067JH00_JATCU|nr:hypothetical protein JCGZ_00463 [Jatropha curcas]
MIALPGRGVTGPQLPCGSSSNHTSTGGGPALIPTVMPDSNHQRNCPLWILPILYGRLAGSEADNSSSD